MESEIVSGRGRKPGPGIERARREAARELRAFVDDRGQDASWFAARARLDVTHAFAILSGAVAPTVAEAERIAELLASG